VVFFWIADPSQASCNLRYWLVGFGFLLGYGSILAKNMRLYLIFSGAKKLKVKAYSDPILLLYLACAVSPGLLILILWCAIDRLEPSTFAYSTYDESTNLYWVNCHNRSLGYLGAFIGYMGLLVLIGFYVAFKTRHIDKKFSEALYIGYVTYNLAVFGGISIPLIFLIQDPTAKFVIEEARNWGLIFLAWMIMTLPKIFYMAIGASESNTTTPSSVAVASSTTTY